MQLNSYKCVDFGKHDHFLKKVHDCNIGNIIKVFYASTTVLSIANCGK